MRVLIPNFSCIVHGPATGEKDTELDAAIAAGYSQIYIQTATGIIKHHVLHGGKPEEPLYVRIPVDAIPGVSMQVIQPEIKFLPDGKVPTELLHEVKAFFRKVIEQKGAAVEAMIWVLWSREQGYFLHVPNQVVSHASAVYDWAGLPRNSMIVVDIHSHADFQAFFSGTDDRDDSNCIRFSVVIGHNNKPVQSIKARFSYLGVRKDVTIADIFEEKAPGEIETPQTWLEAVKTNTPIAMQGGRSGMDGNFRHPQSPVYQSGPNYSGGAHRSPSSYPGYNGYSGYISEKNKEAAKTGTPDHSHATSKYYGGLPRCVQFDEGISVGPSSRQDDVGGRNSGMYEGGIDSPRLVNLHGQDFVDTGNGLMPVPTGSRTRVDMENLDSILRSLPDDVEERMEQAAQRQAQEDLLSEQADAHIGKGEYIEEEIGITLTKNELPPEYDLIAANHGVTVANAYAIIDAASTDLIESGKILAQSVENLFQLVPDEDKLKTFKELAGLLPPNAINDLATNGF